MTEPAQPEQPPARPVPDLDFFAGPVRGGGQSGGGGSHFGGGSAPTGSQFGTPVTNQFGTPAATNQFGTPVTNQFGTAPAVTGPFSPAPVAAQPAPVSASVWKLAVAGVAVVLAVALFFVGRFGWQQFVADPVLPESLGGMPRLAGDADQFLAGAEDGLTAELSAGSEVKAAFYSDGMGTGYMLFAVRGGGSGPGSGDSDDPFASWTESSHDGTKCYSQPAQNAAGVGVTMCLKGFWRRGVVVMGMGLTPPDATVVARATTEAWDAQ